MLGGPVMTPDTTSLWLATSDTPRYEPLRGDIKVDVAIIGAGITGLTAAVLLKERGKSVAVIEKDRIAVGESGFTTAHLTEAVDARYHSLQRSFSKDDARLVAEASRASIEQIRQLIERYGIECRFRRVPGYLYTEKRSFVAEVKKEVAAGKEVGLDVSWTEEIPLPFLTRGACRFENQAQFHPREYLAALAAQVPGGGSHLFERSAVTEIRDGVVWTESGRVMADVVFMATNVPIDGWTPIHIKASPYRTYAIAYEAQGEHPEGLFWDTADPYHYTRWQDTNEGTFMIVGGEDHKVGQEDDTEGCFARLEQYVQEHFGPQKMRYRWSGQVIEPHDGLPFIGGNGKNYISTGYAGQGMTFGTFGGMLVADLITGVENRWAKLFDPHRVHLRGAVKDLVMENVDFPAHLVADRLMKHDVESKQTVDVHSGEGKILEIEGKKIAAYRDDFGTLHCLSPVCTHMKCDVAWNAAERSWDCPCHGSRFTPDGQVLNGPAKKPLEKVDVPEAT